MNLNRIYILLLVSFLVIVLTNPINGQTDFEKWQFEQESQYTDYKQQMDNEFAEYLRSQWKEFSPFPPLKIDQNPKPLIMPVAPLDKLIDDDKLPPSPPVLEPELIKSPETIYEDDDIIDQTGIMPEFSNVDSNKSVTALTVPAFNVVFMLDLSVFASLVTHENPNNEVIADFWEKISRVDLSLFVSQLDEYRSKGQYNDWIFAKLINDASTEIFPYSPSSATLMTWYLLLKFGYDTKLGYDSTDVYLLSRTDYNIYNIKYYILDGEKYFLLLLGNQQEPQNSLFIFTGVYPQAEKPISLRMNTVPLISNKYLTQKLIFTYNKVEYEIAFRQNTQWLDFLNEYPQTDFRVYFSAGISQVTANSLIKQFKDITSGWNEEEIINLLLRFVQTGFGYKTDEINFGKEKYMFPEETLSYKYSDCEDRTALFLYLIRNLTDSEAIALDYPGHIAAAVSLDSQIEGQTVKYNNHDFYICDPSYYYASIGMCMPEYEKTVPVIIDVNK